MTYISYAHMCIVQTYAHIQLLFNGEDPSVNTETLLLLHQYRSKMQYLCSLEIASVIQKLMILECKNGLVFPKFDLYFSNWDLKSALLSFLLSRQTENSWRFVVTQYEIISIIIITHYSNDNINRNNSVNKIILNSLSAYVYRQLQGA